MDLDRNPMSYSGVIGKVCMFRKVFCRVISLVLVIAIFLQTLPVGLVSAAQAGNQVIRDKVQSDNNLGKARVESHELRTAEARHFRNSDGSVTAEIYASPVMYKDEIDIWRKVDTQLVESEDANFGYKTINNRFNAI